MLALIPQKALLKTMLRIPDDLHMALILRMALHRRGSNAAICTSTAVCTSAVMGLSIAYARPRRDPRMVAVRADEQILQPDSAGPVRAHAGRHDHIRRVALRHVPLQGDCVRAVRRDPMVEHRVQVERRRMW